MLRLAGGVLRATGYIIGALVLLGAAWLYAQSLVWQHSHNPQPLIVPFSSEAGTARTYSIPVDMTRDYDIVIAFERNVASDQGRTMFSFRMIGDTR